MTHLKRRHFLAGTAALAALAPARAFAQLEAALGRGAVLGSDYGLVSTPVPVGDDPARYDQSARFEAAMRAAAAAGLPLFVPAGFYAVGNLDIPPDLTIAGVRGATTLIATGDTPILRLNAGPVTLRDLALDGRGRGASEAEPALLRIVDVASFSLEGLELRDGRGNGILVSQSSGRIASSMLIGMGESGIHMDDAIEVTISQNRISTCGNGGIRVWGSGSYPYRGVSVTDNDIADIGSEGGGNGQNGNGINVFRAQGVIVSGNRMRNCAFSAIRLNGTTDSIVSGNTCFDSGEVAIFSEFGFSGSVIADNIVERAALGISLTNFNEGGRLASCTGNIVRNIAPRSLVNPDTVPVGIYAEADTIVANNVVDGVPGTGIAAGWGPYLRDVTISANLVRDADLGIAVSVAEGAGTAVVTGNRIAGARRAGIAATAWQDIVSPDLVRDAGKFPALTISNNSIG